MNRTFSLVVLLLCVAWTHQISVFAEVQPAKVEKDFRSVAKHAIPAVVSINVKFEKSGSSLRGKYSQAPSDFEDDFFQRFFFGIPSPQSKQSQEGQASGFIVSADGYIVTNSHVVSDATEIKVILNDGNEFPAKLVGQDPSTDIAIIKIDGKNLPYLKFGNSDDLEVGQWVTAIGNSLGLQATLTVGVVSAKGRDDLDIARIEDFIQTDAAINRGNSGGPLLNMDGEVVGVNTAIATNLTSGGYMGVGFAIPSNIVKHDMHEILDHGTVARGFLGITIQKVDQDLASAFGLEKPEGILVAEVSKDSPAEKAGIKQGDIILKLNKNSLLHTAAFRNAISLMTPGTQVALMIMHPNRSIEEIHIAVGNFPTETPVANKEVENSKLGIEVQNLTPELARNLSYEGKGVIISKIASGSLASLTGMKKGSIIVSVNHQAINSTDEFKKAVDNTEKGKPILLLIKQDSMTRFVSIKEE